MPPEVRKFYKERVGNFMSILLLITVALCWIVMVLLSFTGVMELISWGVGALQDVFITGWLFFLGVYSGERNKLTKTLATIIPGIILLIPFLNDFPAEILEMGVLLFLVRVEDRKLAEEKAAAAKKSVDGETQQRVKYQAAQAAQTRANVQRQQAMQISLAKAQSTPQQAPANDNTSQTVDPNIRPAANDNFTKDSFAHDSVAQAA